MLSYLGIINRYGEMVERFKAHAWKACEVNSLRRFKSCSLRHRRSFGSLKARRIKSTGFYVIFNFVFITSFPNFGEKLGKFWGKICRFIILCIIVFLRQSFDVRLRSAYTRLPLYFLANVLSIARPFHYQFHTLLPE